MLPCILITLSYFIHLLPFTDGETGAQRSKVTCLKSPSWKARGPEYKSQFSTPARYRLAGSSTLGESTQSRLCFKSN